MTENKKNLSLKKKFINAREDIVTDYAIPENCWNDSLIQHSMENDNSRY
jgi:hypothetical protein